MSTRLVVIGNGMAATRLLEELVARDAHRFAITVIGEEAAAGYNRIMLSPWLAGEKSRSELITHPRDWYEQHAITLLSGDPAAAIDINQQCVVTASGVHVARRHAACSGQPARQRFLLSYSRRCPEDAAVCPPRW